MVITSYFVFYIPDHQLQSLHIDLEKSRGPAFAWGTKVNMWCQWKAFVMFCIYLNFEWLPTNVNIVTLYAQMLSRLFKSLDTVKHYVAGVKLMHVLLEKSCEAFDNLSMKLAIRGMARLKSHKTKQAIPITKQLLLQIHGLLNVQNINDIVYCCLFLVVFFTMFMKSNMVVTSLSQKVKCLICDDVLIGKHSLLIIFKWSKTNQFGSRVHKIPLAEIVVSPFCVFTAYKHMCCRIRVAGDQPAFCVLKGSVISLVTYHILQQVLRVHVTKL